MKNGINYRAGTDGIDGSLADVPKLALSEGFINTTPAKLDVWDPGFVREDPATGENIVGDPWAYRKTGACGRPNGNER